MRPRRRAALTAALTVVLVVAAGLSRATLHAQARSVTVLQALDMYERGDTAVLTAFGRSGLAAGVLDEFRRSASKWIAARGKDAAPRRRLVVATFALEAAKGGGWGLIEWACDQLRPPHNLKTPLPEERLWQEAALAELESQAPYYVVQAHLWHLNTRFKDVPLVLLARGWTKQGEWEAIPAEIAAIPSAATYYLNRAGGGAFSDDLWRPFSYQDLGFDPLRPQYAGFQQDGAFPRPPTLPRVDLGGSIWTKPDNFREVGERVIRTYERALASPAVAAEAHLRIGYLRLVSGKSADALAHFEQVPGLTRDRDLLYLTELFTGWAAERAGHLDVAEAAYRRALTHVPSARTAVMWLAAALQSRGQLADAQALIDASLAASSTVADPWPLFGQGDMRVWPATMDRLRAALWSGSSRGR
jgi:tetratricopeptide (TPR) repeat protein